jgi:NRE family putative nickel resistance protein-like MFS transporter
VTSIFGVLRDRELRAFWMSDWISDAGSFVTFIALAVYVNKLTGSPAAVGLALGLRSVPWFTIGPLAGVLADRLDRRAVMVTSNLVRAGLVALLPFTTTLWQIYMIALASAAFGPLFRSARSALLPVVAPEQRLVPALAVMETTHQVLHTVGPALGGLVVLLVGARSAFFVDAASFVVATLFLLGLRPRGRPAPPVERTTALGELRSGVRGLLAVPAVRAYTLLNGALALGWGGVVALLVAYVRDDLGRPGGEYGIVLAFAGLGTVLSSLVIAARDERHSRGPWAMASVVGLGTFLAILGRPSLPALLPIALVAGLADAGVGIPLSATLAESLPDALRGRAYSVAAAATEFASAVGSIGFAWLGDPARLGVTHAMALSAGIGFALAGVVLAAGGAAAIRRTEHGRLAGRRSAGVTGSRHAPEGPSSS